jgi:predicted kinase
MPTLHLLHGIVGSGKTTLARRLERELPAVRFSPDEWMVALHGTNPPEALFRMQRERILALVWEQVGRVLRAGADVVFDGGFWTRASRDEARRRARELGVECRLHAVTCRVAEARRRTLARTAALSPGTLEITGETFDLLLKEVEPLGPDEPHTRVQGESGGSAVQRSGARRWLLVNGDRWWR